MEAQKKPVTRYRLFKKAKNQHYTSTTKHTGTGRTKEYYTCEDIESQKEHSITINRTDKGLVFECDCTSRSLSGNKEKGTYSPHICSHMLTIIFYLYHQTKIK